MNMDFFNIKSLLAALIVLAGFLFPLEAAGKILTESAWFESATPFVEPEEAGRVTAQADGWFRWEPSGKSGKGKSVTIRIPVTDVRFRAFNQFYAEFENANTSFDGDVRLALARPRFKDVKGKHTLSNGMTSAKIHIHGIGAPARAREAKLIITKEIAATLTKPIRMRFRLRLTDYNYKKTFGDTITAALEHQPPSGLTDTECAAGLEVNRQLRNTANKLKQSATSATATMAERIKAHEQLLAIRDEAPWQIERAALQTAAKAERAQGKLFHGIATGMDKIARADTFIGSFRSAATVELARGEAEGTQIALFSDVPLADVSWAVTPLRDTQGNTATGLCISINPVGYVETGDPAYIPPRQFRTTAPDPIMAHVKTVNLTAAEFQPFYLDISASAAAKPGVYHGSVVFRAAGNGLQTEVPLTVTVHSFELKHPRSLPAVFSSTTFSHKNPLLKVYAKDDETRERYIRFLGSNDGRLTDETESVKQLWTIALDMHRLLADHNIPTQDIYGHLKHIEPDWLRAVQLADSPAWYCLGYNSSPVVERVAAQLEPMRKDDTSKAAYLYGFDEIRMSDPKAFARMKRDFGAVKAAFPEVRTMCTALDGSFGEASGTTNEVDIWVCPSASYPGAQKAASRARARGKQVWYYPCNYPYHPNANFHLENIGAATRVLTGFFPWKYKADGLLYYATAMFTVETSVRDEHGAEKDTSAVAPRILPKDPVLGQEYCYSVFRSNGDGTLFYAGPRGVLPSLRLKLIRDGLDDYEYLKMLNAAATRVRSGELKVPNRQAFLSEADALLAIPDNLCRGDTGYPASGAGVLAWRTRIAKLLNEAVNHGF